MARKKPLPPVSDINVTPMVDVMLVILIIFMVITPMLNKTVSVEMVKSNNPIAMQDADKEDAVVVAITRDGRTYLGSNPVNVADLSAKVKDLQTDKTDKTVYIRSDARARYEKVVDVVDNLRTAGIDQLGLLTDRARDEKDNAAPAPSTAGD
jgi:biopolymer transport protein ExbD/biopolymer transport protein TolR